ncbi:MAG: hypothetical protein Q8K82_03075 [Gemmatimonadaceae bacterium]|nr:hypothetical protein [Gemmatimonadaceae bacterium]
MRHTTGTHSRVTFASRRFRATPRAVWLGARAKNILRRRGRLFGWGGTAWLIVLLAYLLLPAGARGVLDLVRPGRVEWRDTTILLARERAALARASAADSALRRVRLERNATLQAMAPRGLSKEQSAMRDSMALAAGALGALVQRATNAPLAESFRALGESPSLKGDAAVRALVDSLSDVERERDELGGGATVDPVFVALTTQAIAFGRAIQSLAEVRLGALKREISAVQSAPQPAAADSASLVLPDTTQAADASRRTAAQVAVAQRSMSVARAANQAADSVNTRERSRTQLAPLPLLMVSAAIIAAALAFAIALLEEMRSPRVADATEAERLTLLRVLAVVGIRPVPAERMRRAADRTLPSLLDPTFDAYRILAWHLASQWPADGVITVTGDNALVAATIAANLAAVLANDARITLLVDADFVSEPVRAALELPESPGLAAVLDNRRKWSESLISVAVGRSRTMDVLPSGSREKGLGPAESEALVGEIRRAARRHDATIVVTTLTGAKHTRAGDDVIVCASQTRTRLATLARTVALLAADGARVRGVVLWEGDIPDTQAATPLRRSFDADASRAA